jgi:hypothetical protein
MNPGSWPKSGKQHLLGQEHTLSLQRNTVNVVVRREYMKPSKLIVHCIIVVVVLLPLSPVLCRAASPEEIFEKIKSLEMQIQELKDMKAQQNKTEEKAQHCIRAVGAERFCKCLAEALPVDMSFQQYVHIMVSSSEALPDASGKGVNQRNGDGVSAARDKCMQKGNLW